MSRIIVTKGATATWAGMVVKFTKGETLEDPGGSIGTAITAAGGAFRTLSPAVSAVATRDQMGESVGVSNSSA